MKTTRDDGILIKGMMDNCAPSAIKSSLSFTTFGRLGTTELVDDCSEVVEGTSERKEFWRRLTPLPIAGCAKT